jgi:SAM-dependent methyltransferase
MVNFLLEIKNTIDYPLRQLFKWQRKGLIIKNEEKDSLFNGLPEVSKCLADDEVRNLVSEYHLQKFYNNSTRKNFLENLYYLNMLLTAFNKAGFQPGENIRVADIGTSSWFYIQSYYSLMKYFDCIEGRMLSIDGFEADPYRVYQDLFSRSDYARYYKQGLNHVSFIPEKFSLQADTYDVITMLFPFIFKKDHTQWGLPNTQFNPTDLLSDAWQSLKPGGIIIVANQGVEEHLEEIKLFKECGIPIEIDFIYEYFLFKYDIHRFILGGVKHG